MCGACGVSDCFALWTLAIASRAVCCFVPFVVRIILAFVLVRSSPVPETRGSPSRVLCFGVIRVVVPHVNDSVAPALPGRALCVGPVVRSLFLVRFRGFLCTSLVVVVAAFRYFGPPVPWPACRCARFRWAPRGRRI